MFFSYTPQNSENIRTIVVKWLYIFENHQNDDENLRLENIEKNIFFCLKKFGMLESMYTYCISFFMIIQSIVLEQERAHFLNIHVFSDFALFDYNTSIA